MRVLHVFGAMNRGGAEMRTVSLMKKMQTKGVQFDYCVLSGEKGVLDDHIRSLGGQVFYCKLNLIFIFKFVSLLRQQRFDAVHSHVAYVSGFILLLAKLGATQKRIAHFRNTTAGTTSTFVRKYRDLILKGLIKLFATDILAVCYGAMDGFWGENWQKEKRCQVLYNGFEIPDERKITSFWRSYIPEYSNQKVVINVARMDVQKNHLRQCAIFSELVKLIDNTVMVFIGKENDQTKSFMLDILEAKGIKEKVYFLGLQTDVLKFLSHADVMLFPSEWEGLPGVVLEAASVDLPVVASDLPGVKEIADQLPGISIVKRSDEDGVWANRLCDVLHSKKEKNMMSDAFRRSDFLIENNVALLDEIYSK